MSEIIYKKTQVLKAPIEKVFKTITEIENFPKWNPTTPVTRKISSGEPRQGSELEMKLRGFGLVKQTLDEFEDHKQVMNVQHIKMLGDVDRVPFDQLGQNGTRGNP